MRVRPRDTVVEFPQITPPFVENRLCSSVLSPVHGTRLKDVIDVHGDACGAGAGSFVRVDDRDHDGGSAGCAKDENIGARLGLPRGMSALAVIEIVDDAKANAGHVHAIEAGTALSGRTLIAFGDGGTVHATRSAQKMDLDRVLVPSGAGAGSAVGSCGAPAPPMRPRFYVACGKIRYAALDYRYRRPAADCGLVLAVAWQAWAWASPW